MTKVKLNKKKAPKEVINVIRTALRNNIELTNIADNKSNTLLTLNSLMLSILVPLALANLDMLQETRLFIPLIIIILTCFITIVISTFALKPGKFNIIRDEKIKQGINYSPFFFGNFYEMRRTEFLPYMKQALENPSDLREYLADDLFYTGKRLGIKMTMIKMAFNIFIVGLGSAMLAACLIVLFF